MDGTNHTSNYRSNSLRDDAFWIYIYQIYRSLEQVENLVVKVDDLLRDSLDLWDGMSDDLWAYGFTVSFCLNATFLFNRSQMNDLVIQHRVTADAIQSQW